LAEWLVSLLADRKDVKMAVVRVVRVVFVKASVWVLCLVESWDIQLGELLVRNKFDMRVVMLVKQLAAMKAV